MFAGGAQQQPEGTVPVGAMPCSQRTQTSGAGRHGWCWHSSFAMECLQAADTDLERGLPEVGPIHPLLENFRKWPKQGLVSQRCDVEEGTGCGSWHRHWRFLKETTQSSVLWEPWSQCVSRHPKFHARSSVISWLSLSRVR